MSPLWLCSTESFWLSSLLTHPHEETYNKFTARIKGFLVFWKYTDFPLEKESVANEINFAKTLLLDESNIPASKVFYVGFIL